MVVLFNCGVFSFVVDFEGILYIVLMWLCIGWFFGVWID